MLVCCACWLQMALWVMSLCYCVSCRLIWCCIFPFLLNARIVAAWNDVSSPEQSFIRLVCFPFCGNWIKTVFNVRLCAVFVLLISVECLWVNLLPSVLLVGLILIDVELFPRVISVENCWLNYSPIVFSFFFYFLKLAVQHMYPLL